MERPSELRIPLLCLSLFSLSNRHVFAQPVEPLFGSPNSSSLQLFTSIFRVNLSVQGLLILDILRFVGTHLVYENL